MIGVGDAPEPYPGWFGNIMAQAKKGKVDQRNIDDLMPRVLQQAKGRSNYIYDAQAAKKPDDPDPDPYGTRNK